MQLNPRGGSDAPRWPGWFKNIKESGNGQAAPGGLRVVFFIALNTGGCGGGPGMAQLEEVPPGGTAAVCWGVTGASPVCQGLVGIKGIWGQGLPPRKAISNQPVGDMV